MVRGRLGWGSVVFAAITALAPSRAARRAIAFPIPRLAPETSRVRPARERPNTVGTSKGPLQLRGRPHGGRSRVRGKARLRGPQGLERVRGLLDPRCPNPPSPPQLPL